MRHLALPSYVPALGEAKTNFALHKHRRSAILRRWHCERCKQRRGRGGCEYRHAARRTYDRHAGDSERMYDISCGHLFTDTEEIHFAPITEFPTLPAEAGRLEAGRPALHWGSAYPVDAKAVRA